MIIAIDNREQTLISAINTLVATNEKFNGLVVKIENLPIGDIIIRDELEDRVIIERKSISDLSCSIRDGRYEEQSYRLDGIAHPNHNIIYLIEGDLTKAIRFKDKAEQMTLMSAIFSLNYYKGFSIMRTISMDETALFVCNSALKLLKIGTTRTPYYNTTSEESPQTTKDYVGVVKKVKKDNITPDNIGELMLCQIPGISSVSAIAILEKFKTMKNLIHQMETDPECLNNISYTNAKGDTRKLNKTVVEQLRKYI